MSQVWDDGPNDKSEILVLIALADFCNDSGECWPSIGTIARKSRMTERGVQKIIARLCSIGWITIDPKAGRRGCNLYVITPPNPVHPRTPFTPNPVTPPPNPVRVTPEPRSPEPLITIIEPSVDTLCISPRGKPKRRRCAIPDDWVQSDRNIADAKARNFSHNFGGAGCSHALAVFRHLARRVVFKRRNHHLAWG